MKRALVFLLLAIACVVLSFPATEWASNVKQYAIATFPILLASLFGIACLMSILKRPKKPSN